MLPVDGSQGTDTSVAWWVSRSQYFNHFGWLRDGDSKVSTPRAFIKACVALALASGTFFTASAYGQSPAARPDSTVAVSEAKPGSCRDQGRGNGVRRAGTRSRATDKERSL